MRRGLPWTGYVKDGAPYYSGSWLDTFPNATPSGLPFATRYDQQPTVTDTLNLAMQYIDRTGLTYQWTVDRRRQLCFDQERTSPDYTLLVRQAPARTVASYFTALWGEYVAQTGTVKDNRIELGENAAALAAGLPRIEGTISMGENEVGILDGVDALGLLDNILSRDNYELAWASPLVVGAGDLVRPAGVATDFAFVRAGSRFRPTVLDPGRPSQLGDDALLQDFTASEIELDVDSWQLTVYPRNHVDRSLRGALADILDATGVGI
jgi:hypothetical protein